MRLTDKELRAALEALVFRTAGETDDIDLGSYERAALKCRTEVRRRHNEHRQRGNLAKADALYE